MLDDEPERPRGILSKADRKYLNDPENYGSRQAKYNRQQDIPVRIRHAFLDFSILADPRFPVDFLSEATEVSDEKLAAKLEAVDSVVAEVADVGGSNHPAMDPDVREGLVDCVAMIYRLTSFETFCDVIEKGVERAVQRYEPDARVVDASYNPKLERRELDYQHAKNKFDIGVPLTDEEIRLLLERGEVDPTKIAEFVREMGPSGEIGDAVDEEE